MKKPSLKVMAISDMHHPFVHPCALDFLVAVHKKQKPDVVVCLGDEIDACALSDWEHDPDGMSAGDELRSAIQSLKPFYQAFPVVHVCTSNHTSRPYRQAHKHGIPKLLMRDYRDWLGAPKGWQWADEWVFDDVCYEHGDAGRSALELAIAGMRSVVAGHIHTKANIQFYANAVKTLWGMQCGWMGDRRAYAMKYASKQKAKGILATGIVNRAMPFIHPLLLDSRGRWTGAM